jgi:hypothetical protein
MVRIATALEPGESMNSFLKAAVEAELKRRERKKPDGKG